VRAMALCKFVKPDGSPCKAPAGEVGERCFFHDPKYDAERKAASAAGGAARRKPLPPDPPEIKLRDNEQIRRFNELLVNFVLRGQLDHTVLYALIPALSLQARLLAGEDVEKRVEALELVLYDRKRKAK
jgi:hypothetical protein